MVSFYLFTKIIGNYYDIYACSQLTFNWNLFIFFIELNIIIFATFTYDKLLQYLIVLGDSLKLKTVNASERGENPKLTL